MKLSSLQFYNRKIKLRTDTIQFDDKITLLLGKSGSGKSLILKTISNLYKEMSGNIRGYDIENVKWEISGLAKTSLYTWKGCKGLGEYIHESLFFKGVTYFDRDKNREKVTYYDNRPYEKNYYVADSKRCYEEDEPFGVTINLDNHSLIPFSDIEDFRELIDESKYNYIYPFDSYIYEERRYSKQDILLEDIQKSEGSIESKYEYLVNTDHNVIRGIRYFIESYLGEGCCYIPKSLYLPLFDTLPDGYKKLLKLVATVYLSPSNSIILIDNIEDKLDITFLEAVIDLLTLRDDIQYIIATHHHYLINKIPMKHWRVLSKENDTIVSRDYNELNLGKSKHEAFMQLINLDCYC